MGLFVSSWFVNLTAMALVVSESRETSLATSLYPRSIEIQDYQSQYPSYHAMHLLLRLQ